MHFTAAISAQLFTLGEKNQRKNQVRQNGNPGHAKRK